MGLRQGFGWLGWSPDGRQIVSMSSDESAEATLVNLADGTRRSVPRWYAEDWQRLAFDEVEQPTAAPGGP